ncbi:divergent polysaccharide deacetylase family protein [Tianweitania sp.]|uniref:divergent polysaccharide deacetylase family protein n=1 Tax=Tianweitania sp. TaxID=2021634 RepID=UPI00289C888C|nr:divergent polysaccharide deacetylase family protein [Tianweitania sp.]
MAGQERGGDTTRIRDIDLPLGLGIRGPAKPTRSPRFTSSSMLTTVVAVALAGSAGAIALRDRGIRMPSAAVVSVPMQTAASEAEPSPAPRPSLSNDPAGGPAIIRVNPDSDPAQGTTIIRSTSAPAQDAHIAHLPDQALIEAGPDGPLPQRAADGRRPFDVYARPWSGARGARIALVIGGLGVSQTGTQKAIEKLPPEITLAFASGGNSLSRWMEAARRNGHEIVLQVPLEPFDYPAVDPGRATLTVDAPASETVENLQWVLARTTNYVGVMNYMGARFLGETQPVGTMMAELGKRGLAYVDDGSTARNESQPLAKANRVPFAASDMQIDAVRERGEILGKLDDLERTARANEFAVGTGSAFDVTVDTVTAWAAEVRRRGVEIVPITAVADDPERR